LVDRHQGDTFIVSGRLRTESWEKDGTKRTQLILIANALHPVSSPKGSGTEGRHPEPAGAGANGGGNTPADGERPPF
jgi:single-stranded DNA-binding protein